MALFDDIKSLFTAPAPAPEVEAARAAVPVPVPVQHPAAVAAGELELTQSCVQQIIEPDEGDVLHAYPDPATHGDPWTIGYGHTGPEVHAGLVWTQTQADAALEQDLGKFSTGVDAMLPGYLSGTNDSQFSAMVSLAYNIGLGNFKSSSVLRFHNAGQYSQAADAFLLWDKGAGQVMPGLVRRRHQERELYLGLAVTESGT